MAMFKGSQDRRTRDASPIQEQNESGYANGAEIRQPKCLRWYISQLGFIDSGGIKIGSSSLPHDDLYDGSQGSSLVYVDPDTHYLGITPEDNTLRPALCVIRHTLYFALLPLECIRSRLRVDRTLVYTPKNDSVRWRWWTFVLHSISATRRSTWDNMLQSLILEGLINRKQKLLGCIKV